MAPPTRKAPARRLGTSRRRAGTNVRLAYATMVYRLAMAVLVTIVILKIGA
jgi:hypothetical protein